MLAPSGSVKVTMAIKAHLFQIFGKLFNDNGCHCRQSLVVDDQFGRHMPHGPNHYMAVATAIVLIGQNPDAVMKNIPGGLAWLFDFSLPLRVSRYHCWAEVSSNEVRDEVIYSSY